MKIDFKLKVYCLVLVVSFLSTSIPLKAQDNNLKISKGQLYNKIYASWLGQTVGNIYVLLHENANIDKSGPANFPYGYGTNIKMLKKYDGAFPNDDTNIEHIYLLQINKSHFVHYKLNFSPIATKGIRIIGQAGSAKHWHYKPAHFTSIKDLKFILPLKIKLNSYTYVYYS